MTDAFFDNPDHDRKRYQAELKKKPAPIRNYIIFFTPRSGSSWLADIMKSTGKMGHPGEWLNPSFIPGITKSMNSYDPRSYFAMLRRRQSFGRIFGMEVTYFQLNKIFPDNEKLFEIFRIGCPKFYLLREDIVSQAVSLSKAVATSVYHSPQAEDGDLQRADNDYAYDAAHIREWLLHIRRMEEQTEEFFQKFELKPRRFSYEEMQRRGPDATVRAFARQLKVDLGEDTAVRTTHNKIATVKNDEFSRRFRQDQEELVIRIEAEREPLLETVRRSQKRFFAQDAKTS